MRKPSQDSIIRKFNILIDTREQQPYLFPNSVEYTLPYGDYSIEYNGAYYYNQIIVERKGAVSELFSATGSQRDRWERELEKLRVIPIRLVLCEFDYMDIVNDQPPGKLPASAVYGSIAKWHGVFNIPFIFCGNKRNARGFLFKLFYEFVKYKIVNDDI